MKAVKFSVAAAAALALSTAALADGPVVYGKQNVEVGSFDSGPTVGGETMGAKTQSSRFGIKGSHDLGDGLTGLYQIEIQHNLLGGIAEDDVDDGKNVGFGARNSFLGVSGDFGTFIAGNHDHPSKLALYQSGAGVFAADTTAKLVQAEFRSSPAAAYVGKAGGMSFAAAVVFDGKDSTPAEDLMHIDVAAWGAAGDIKYGVGVIIPDAENVDPIMQASVGMNMDALNVGASVQMGDESLGANADMNIILQANMKLDGGMYAGVGAELFMADAATEEDKTDIGLIVGKKYAEGKFDVYLAVKNGDSVVANGGTDVAVGLTASF
ncbi:MAG: porin [Campylobacterales bacterium]